MKTYTYEKVKIKDIKTYENNARIHSSDQIEQIKQSIKNFGFTNPILIDENYNLIAGHGRLEAILQLNKIDFKENPVNEIPCIIISGLSKNDYKALVLADNKIALNATWDEKLLINELNLLENENYNLDLIGFSDEELSELLKVDLECEIDGGGGVMILGAIMKQKILVILEIVISSRPLVL